MTSQDEVVYRFPKWDMETDVVVVGHGGAGAVTAITAHDAGAEVMVLEKLPADVVDAEGNVKEIRHHPSSRITAAGIFTPSDPEGAYVYQKRMNELYGYDDVPDDMLRAWSELVVQNMDWLKTLKGSEIFVWRKPTEPEFPDWPGAKTHRAICNPQAGYGWFGCLDRNVKDRGIEVLYSTPAKELVQNPNTKEILGVIAEQDGKTIAIKAKRGVVLTCGGFEFDMEMQSNYLRVWPFRFYGNPGNTGDGVKMAIKIGAALWHMNNVSGRVTAHFPDFPTNFRINPGNRSSGWELGHIDRNSKTPRTKFESSYSHILVDKYGKRFVDDRRMKHAFYWEVVNFDTAKSEFPRIPCHLIFDEKTRTEGPLANRMGGASGPIQMYEWSDDNSKEIAKGWIVKADTIRELAEKVGIPADSLEEEVAKWNEYCKQGKDLDFDREARSLIPIDSPPYYEITHWPGGPNTQGGAKRNKDAQVVDPDDKPIPRLYSAGEFGSMFGFLYQGGSNTSECITSGRQAGENAAAEKPWS
ncbi:FAD-binding protein [Chloroflexota bacterium]